ncbi:Thiamine biosynthesis lipoprotein ApbE precursor [Pirellula sp. SH-Sr6A]|uniref:FAD:protein FMN transferase n=1 Tax=Pirellula sp. SH-Sr6A TaxID=1632865 RepID=UPI00078B7C2B|nr:FAD:protein FMN transferase [Pirellula sp. SH-Sr6A]AMV34236.1 Thiamine biosynthesis lipoprotein ApbE precursor [Pirellula sp. SH-Sr6A]
MPYPNRKGYWYVCISFALIACTSRTVAQEGAPLEVHRIRGTTMGMAFQCQIADAIDPSHLESIHQETAAELERLEAIFSLYRPESALSRWNACSSTDWNSVPSEVIQLLDFALVLHHKTSGKFDPTIAPLMRVWRVGSLAQDWHPPTQAEIGAAKNLVGISRLEWRASPPQLRKNHPAMELDLNALVEGLALRNLERILDQHGVSNYLLHLGGEFYARGNHPNRGDWTVLLEDPEGPGGNDLTHDSKYAISLRDESISTSGSYRIGKEYEGRHHSHFIDPGTGDTVQNRNRSVSVVSKDPLEADGWATALMLLEPEQAIELANERNLIACWATQDGWQFSQAAIRQSTFQSLSEHASQPPRPSPQKIAPNSWRWLQSVWLLCLGVLLAAKLWHILRGARS